MNGYLSGTLELFTTITKALILVTMVCGPLVAGGVVHAQGDNILLGASQKGAGAGFVLMVSLQRAQ